MESKGRKKEILFLAALLAVLVAADQVTKILAQSALEDPDRTVTIVPGCLSLSFFRNEITGWFAHAFRIFFAFILMPALLISSVKQRSPVMLRLGLVFLLAFSLSNGILDLFWLGYVRDFIHLHGVAVGNLADQYRNVGIILVLLGLLQASRKPVGWARLLGGIVVILLGLVLFYKYLFPYLGF